MFLLLLHKNLLMAVMTSGVRTPTTRPVSTTACWVFSWFSCIKSDLQAKYDYDDVIDFEIAGLQCATELNCVLKSDCFTHMLSYSRRASELPCCS